MYDHQVLLTDPLQMHILYDPINMLRFTISNFSTDFLRCHLALRTEVFKFFLKATSVTVELFFLQEYC